jgi:thioredoxin-like negative regulator of GroEL
VNPVNANNARVVVVVFTIPGCDACAEYKPRFQHIAQHYERIVPIYMLNANDTRPGVADLASRLNVTSVPATFVLRRPTGMIRYEGAISDEQIAWLLGVAAREATNPY